jgi:ABC-type antimicrobial peptide transport system permease subunit
MKPRLYWSYATRSLARGGQRTLLAILCVAIGVLAVVAMQLAGNMVNVSLTGNIRDLNGGDVVLTDVRLATGQLGYFAQLRSQGTLTDYTAVAATQGSARGRQPVARIDGILAVDPAHFPLAGAPAFEAPRGGSVASALGGTGGTDGMRLIVTHDLAQRLGVSADDVCMVYLTDGRPASFTVGGVIANAGLFQRPTMLIAFDSYLALRTATAPPLRYNAVYADVPGHSMARAEQVKQQLLSQFSEGLVLTTGVLLDQNRQRVQDIRSFLNVAGLAALLIGGIGIINTLQVLLRRRRDEIAMLKTAGYRRRDLYALFGLEAVLLGLIGGALGAGAGVGVSLLIRPLFEHAFSLTLPVEVDPWTVGLGIVMGGATALIFGLQPIVRASQVRPLAVLRELPDGVRVTSRLSAALLGLVLAVLFVVLAWSIVRNALLAVELVAGAALAFGALTLCFAGLATALSRLPVVVPLPGRWRSQVKLALRNLGRQRARTATTQVALFLGVFGVGAILLIGQGLQAQYTLAGNTINATLGVQPAAYATVARRIQQTAAITRHETYAQAGYQLVAINGATASNIGISGSGGPGGSAPFGSAMVGFDLAGGQLPVGPDITLDAGRMLTAGDAGTTNALLEQDATPPELNLRIGDTITVEQTSKFSGPPPHAHMVTLTIVGYYTNHAAYAERAGNLLVDRAVVTALDPDNYFDLVVVHVDPQEADSVLGGFVSDFPQQLFIHNYADVFAQFETFFSNLTLLLEAVVVPALLAALITVANAVALAMLERRRELGIFKAVGFTSRGVLGGVLVEQAIAGLISAAAAMLGAAALANIAVQVAGIGTSIAVSPRLVAAIIGACVAACVLVAGGVAWKATRVRPLEVLRYE